MSKQVKYQYDLVAIVTIDENGDNLLFVKKDNGTVATLLKEMPLGASVTFETLIHPSYGEIVVPHIRRGFNQCNTETMRCLLQQAT